MPLKTTLYLLIFNNLLLYSNTIANERTTQPTSTYQTKNSEYRASFLTKDEIANGIIILPPPPAYNSIAFLADKAAYKEGYALQNTPRWDEAANDADLTDNNIGKPFSQALGIEISKTNTPITYHLLKKLLIDSAYLGTQPTKKYYKRVRPFIFFHQHSCTPQDEHILKKDGSYPSGHSAFGWSTALILSEIFPQRQNSLLKKGYDFGQSRVICGVHWQSDVDAGRIIGASIVAKLHTNQNFITELNKVKEEILEKSKINPKSDE
ncbi:acid phosphatase [Commensalibacter oyaizuii]|uniref:Acid phosphatase n=1 Tax=Commensalibacter oyaizuii TaxID=3043873 RepID=A0ABT6Q3J2_9PROT|nr:phosphatase PAP2 family protein [Commensalibacter sp. TBRC 16381]MDI2091667.1 phosphatase PAP2 family protein [Commensalibacter sp. TBRC 16381]